VSVLGRAMPRLVSALRTSPVPFVLMLDDLHALQSPACHDVLGVLIPAIPPGSQLATASRSEQPHLPRRRASGDALEFGAGDLALDAAGAQQVFANKGVSLTAEQAAEVTERTEGWPAGLYLAAVIAKQSHGQAPAVTGDDPYVADYLYREAFIGQPEDLQRFVRRTAVLDQLCGRLCDAVLGSSGAARELRRMEATSMFVTSLDRRREWYRYHDLFREFLLGELRRTEPDLIETLHQRAADWYESNGSPELTIEHLLQTNDWDRTVRLVTKLTMPTYSAGHLPVLQRWYRAIDDVHVERYPPLAVHMCIVSMITGDTAGALKWAAAVDAASFDGVPADGTASFESSRAMLRAFLCAAGPEQMMADAIFAVTHESAWSPYRDTVLWLLAEAHLLAGHLDEACSLLAEASTTAVAVGSSDNIVGCESHLGWLAMDRGDWQEAASRLEVALATIEEKRMHDYVFSIPAFAAAARLCVHHGDLDEARRQLTRAMRARPSATYLVPYHAVRLRLQLARVYLAIAEVATARQLLREIDGILRHRAALGTLAVEVEEFRGALISSGAPTEVAGRLPLTPAELRLLPYLQTHLTAGQIAERLFITKDTVKTHMRSIYRKLGVSSRNEAVQKATAVGLLGG
jgi:LuxR family maltose regulon positive regulatory protein